MTKRDVQAHRRASSGGSAHCLDCGMREAALFADLQPDDLALIHLPIEEANFAQGETLYRIGDPATAVFSIRSGLVKLEQYLPNGARRIVRLLRPGDAAGLEAALGQPYAHTAAALRPTTACRIPKGVIDRLSQETPRLQNQLLRRWSQAVERADAFLVELSAGSARARTARLFLTLTADAEDACCDLPGREDVGALLSVTTETASRTVADFKRRKLIEEVQPNRFRCDLAALRDAADAG